MKPALCRLCQQSLPIQPLLLYADMPQAAQFFPTAEQLALDQTVDLRIVQCGSCGLVQLDNPPVPYYRDVIRAIAFSEAMGRFRQQQLAEFVAKHGLEGRSVVEIGCGRGEYLQLLNQQGVKAHGLEHAADSVAACVAQGLAVQQGYVDTPDAELAQAPFDAVFMFNFLEHMPEPVLSLRGIARNLSDGAVGLIEVPNFDMMLRERQFTEFVTDHLSYFTRQTLSLALQLAGFEVLECKEIWQDYIISATVRKRAVLPREGFLQAQQRLTQQLHDFAERFRPDQLAVWGAGHQALAVIAMTGLHDKLRYVVDSAPFKQNKYTPATHLPIVSPEQFYQDAPAGVIIMAAAYSDEVAELIRQHAPVCPQLAILRSDGLQVL